MNNMVINSLNRGRKDVGATGKNYTTGWKCNDLLEKAFLGEWKKDLRFKSEEELLNLRHKACTIKIFDPACGTGAILHTAFGALNRFVSTVDSLLGYSLPELPSPSQLYGIEIDDRAYVQAKYGYDGIHIINENSLEVHWPAFTDGIDDVYLISNFPFEAVRELKKTDVGRKTLDSWKSRTDCSLGRLGTCDIAFFAKAIEYGYKFRAIGNSNSWKAVNGIRYDEDYEWSSFTDGDAKVRVADYYPGEMSFVVKSLSSPLTNAFNCHSKPKGTILPENTWNVGFCFKSFKKAVSGVPTNTQSRYLFNPTEWSIAARKSNAFRVWVEHTATSYISGGSEKQFGVSNTVNTFPLFQGDDLEHYNSMSDEEIWNELYQKYLNLTK